VILSDFSIRSNVCVSMSDGDTSLSVVSCHMFFVRVVCCVVYA